MMVRYVRRLLMIGFVAAASTNLHALEYVVTDTVGGYNNPLNTTTNKLNLGDNPVAKTVYVYIKYSQAEADTINGVTGPTGSTTPGLYGGSFQFTFGTANQVAVKTSSDITRGPAGTTLNWDTFTPNVPPTTGTPRAVFNQGISAPVLTVTDPGVGNFGYYVIGQVLISPGTALTSAGSTVTTSRVTGASWSYIQRDGSPGTFAAPTTFAFTVVPEASTVSMGVLSVASILGSALQRRRKLRSMSKLK